MALGGARRTVAVCLAAGVLASCTRHSEVTLQDPSPRPSSTAPVVASTPTTSMPGSSSVVSITPPLVVPAAQAAVNAFVDSLNLYNAASRDPATADLTGLDAYLTGKARTIYDESIAGMRSAGYAYRGTPANPRVTVQTVLSGTAVQLRSCPIADRSDPFVEYDVKTGRPVPVATASPPPPYRLTIFMKMTADGTWLIYDVLQDRSKTCTG